VCCLGLGGRRLPVTPQQIAAARAIQETAAHDEKPQVRLIAGPGTGKSYTTIEERVFWLLKNGIKPSAIFAISFTNASADDLRVRITQYCQSRGQKGDEVSVTTLHSLAFRMLHAAGLLGRFPSPPLVLDQWELREVFRKEFCVASHIGAERADDIRRDHEAFWSTGAFDPPNYIPPTPPIADTERTALTAFRPSFEQVYSCILPGEIVRECVIQIRAGLVDPTKLIKIEHLIVDEYQDLNPIDLEFISSIIAGGAVAFVAGDDDQSIYSFRFALPRGIQEFPQTYPKCGQHALKHCFRCASEILHAAQTVIEHFPPTNRVPKQAESVYVESQPPLAGSVLRWRYDWATGEAIGIARSCRTLIDAGMCPNDILILLSDTHLLNPLKRYAPTPISNYDRARFCWYSLRRTL
jgi:DNA helicase II / ATP-dependent DNA helicase PcrA